MLQLVSSQKFKLKEKQRQGQNKKSKLNTNPLKQRKSGRLKYYGNTIKDTMNNKNLDQILCVNISVKKSRNKITIEIDLPQKRSSRLNIYPQKAE